MDVGQPKLIRSGGSTWLFWREDNEYLRYLNISELLNAKVGNGPNEEDWTYALQADGTFATDYLTGEQYVPNVRTVDFGSVTESGKLTATDYQVITDSEDNLYVVWTDITTYEEIDPEFDSVYLSQSQPIFATAMIKEQDRSGDALKEGNETGETYTAAWSKPYALTRDHSSNDGVTIALDEEGGLVIVHNRYMMELADTEEEISEMIDRNLAGIWTDEESGKSYFLGYPYYPTQLSLAVTRCEAIGSVEATTFLFDDDTPVAGQTVEVSALVENTGLTSAKGCEISFYEYKDGVQGKLLASVTSDDIFQVNTARKTVFTWTIPADGPEGYCIQAVAREQKTDGSWYDPVETFSDPFHCAAVYVPELVKFTQNGNSFDAEYTVTNTGNLAAPKGTRADLILEGLYGDLKEKYGMDDELLLSEDITGLAPGESRTVTKSVTLPVSVFKFCGYDAVTVVVRNADGRALECTDHNFITLDSPLNVRLGGGETMTLKAGETKETALSYDSTVFMDLNGGTIYSVADPSVANVDENGAVTGLSSGVTTVRATMLPSGVSAEQQVVVEQTGGSGTYYPILPPAEPEPEETGVCDRGETCPMSAFNDLDKSLWYHDGVHWALENGVMNGVGNAQFAPDSATSRAMLVTMLWRMEGCPVSAYALTFKDIPAGDWYAEAVRWAAEKEIVNGYSAEAFGPHDALTREQLAAILCRYAKYKGLDTEAGETTILRGYKDTLVIADWAIKPLRWAVAAGIIKGTGEDTLSPKSQATRAQVAKLLAYYFEAF